MRELVYEEYGASFSENDAVALFNTSTLAKTCAGRQGCHDQADAMYFYRSFGCVGIGIATGTATLGLGIGVGLACVGANVNVLAADYTACNTAHSCP